MFTCLIWNDDDSDDNDKLLLYNSWLTKGVKTYFQSRSLSDILTNVNIQKKKIFFPLNNRTTCWIVGKFSNNCKVLISEPVWGSLGFLSTRLQCFDFGKHAVVQNKDC